MATAPFGARGRDETQLASDFSICIWHFALRMAKPPYLPVNRTREAAVDQARGADRRRRQADEVLLVEQVLHAEEDVEVLGDGARRGELDGGVGRQARPRFRPGRCRCSCPRCTDGRRTARSPTATRSSGSCRPRESTRDSRAPAAGTCRRAPGWRRTPSPSPGCTGSRRRSATRCRGDSRRRSASPRSASGRGSDAAGRSCRPRHRPSTTRSPAAPVTVTFATGFSTRLSNQMLRTAQAGGGQQADADLAILQALGPELIVGQRQDRADAELAIQLVQRRARGSRSPMLPQALTRSDRLVQRRHLRAEHRVLALRQRPVVRGRQPGARRWSRGCARRSCASDRHGRSRSPTGSSAARPGPARTPPPMICWPPELRFVVTVVPVTASIACSWLSPST